MAQLYTVEPVKIPTLSVYNNKLFPIAAHLLNMEISLTQLIPINYSLYVDAPRFPFRQHHGLVQQINFNHGRLQFGRLSVHLHRNRLVRYDPRRSALRYTGAMATRLQQRELVRGQANNLNQPIISRWIVLAT